MVVYRGGLSVFHAIDCLRGGVQDISCLTCVKPKIESTRGCRFFRSILWMFRLPLESGGGIFPIWNPHSAPLLFTPTKKRGHSTHDNNSKTKQSDHLQTRYMQQSNHFPLGHSL